MCGVWGAIRIREDAVINKWRLMLLSSHMEARGKDASGLVWDTDDGKMLFLKKPGPSGSNAYEQIMLGMGDEREVRAVIGHSRATTNGDAATNTNNHPHFAETEGGKVLSVVHNGTVHAFRTLAKAEEITLGTDCDSEIFCEVAAKYWGLGPFEALKKCIDITDPTHDTVLYLHRDGFGYHRKGNPLFNGLVDGVAYYSSLELPLRAIGCPVVHEVKDGCLCWFDRDGSTYRLVNSEEDAIKGYSYVRGSRWDQSYRYGQTYQDLFDYDSTHGEVIHLGNRGEVVQGPVIVKGGGGIRGGIKLLSEKIEKLRSLDYSEWGGD